MSEKEEEEERKRERREKNERNHHLISAGSLCDWLISLLDWRTNRLTSN